MELAFKSFTGAPVLPDNNDQKIKNVSHQCVVVTDSSKGLRSTIIQYVYGVAVTQNLWETLVPKFKTFSADEFRFYLDYDSAAYSDVRPARSDFLSCKTPMPGVFPGARGLSFYDVCDKFTTLPQNGTTFAVDLSKLLHTDAVPAPAPGEVWAELRKGDVKVFCPGGLPERTYFQHRAAQAQAQAQAQPPPLSLSLVLTAILAIAMTLARALGIAPSPAPTKVLHDDSKVHLCVTYDLYLASDPAAGAVGPGRVKYAVPAGANAVTPLLEKFEDRSRPLVQVQVMFQLDKQDDGLSEFDGPPNTTNFKSVIKGRVDAVLANELNAVTAVNHPPLLTVPVVGSYNCKAPWPKQAQKVCKKLQGFHRKHYVSYDITSIIASRNLTVRLTDPMYVRDLFPRLQHLPGLDFDAKHRYYTADASYLKAADIGKRIQYDDPNDEGKGNGKAAKRFQYDDPNAEAFYLTLHDALHNLLQPCINFMRNTQLMTAGHFKLFKIVMNHNVNDNFVVAFAW
eukprot:gene18856-13594_t